MVIPIFSLAKVTSVVSSNEVARNSPKSSALFSNISGPMVGLSFCTLFHPGRLRVSNTLLCVSAIL